MPTRTNSALCFVTWSGSVLTLIPVNDQAETVLAAGYTADSSNTTVAYAQVDAGRAGYGQTDTKALTLTFS